MARRFHVTSTRNRASIEQHGLDWSLMADVPGIAGSRAPEVHGVFLCRDTAEVDFFCSTARGPVDVWAVDGVDDAELVVAPEGFVYVTRPIPPTQLALHDAMRHPPEHRGITGPSSAYRSSLTVTLDDGTVLRDEDARDFARRQGPSSHEG